MPKYYRYQNLTQVYIKETFYVLYYCAFVLAIHQ